MSQKCKVDMGQRLIERITMGASRLGTLVLRRFRETVVVSALERDCWAGDWIGYGAGDCSAGQ